jgi:hypothetical protein
MLVVAAPKAAEAHLRLTGIASAKDDQPSGRCDPILIT